MHSFWGGILDKLELTFFLSTMRMWRACSCRISTQITGDYRDYLKQKKTITAYMYKNRYNILMCASLDGEYCRTRTICVFVHNYIYYSYITVFLIPEQTTNQFGRDREGHPCTLLNTLTSSDHD